MNKDIKINATSNKSVKDIEINKELIMSSFCSIFFFTGVKGGMCSPHRLATGQRAIIKA